MSSKKPQQTLADYVTIALSPVLIMALVGSLIFFLVEVLYVGQYSGRLQWTLFFFVFGIVLIARISIEQGGGRASLYGVGLAVVVWLALQTFVEYPAGSSMAVYSWIINFGLMALAWWCAHRLTWDCTHIDDGVDAAGKGVLEAAGLDETAAAEAEEGMDEAPEDNAKSKASKQVFGVVAWWDRYRRYREEQLRKPHTPGVWVVYFSLAALPLFGLGQSLIPAADAGRRRYAFWLMVCYVGSGLALLVTTSFLGLRRYLRQRKLKMPAAMTGVWMALGGGLIALLMVAGALLPRPYGEYRLIDISPLGSKDRNASRYAVLRDGAGKGEGRPSSDTADQSQKVQSGSGNQPDKEQGGSGDGKSSGGKSGQGGNGSGKQGNQQGTAKANKSGQENSSQSNPQPGNKSGQQGSGQKSDQQSNQDDAQSGKRRDADDAKQTGGRDPSQDGSGGGSGASQSSSSSRPAASNPVSPVLHTLGRLGTVLKWLIFGVLALVVLFFLLRSGLRFLANFTNWAKRLLAAFQAWWAGLFGGGANEPEAEAAGLLKVPAPRPFASFHNPFLDGRADRASPDALVRYSFEALQAWAWEHGQGRQPEETPLEFVERLNTDVPELESEPRRVAALYVHLAYARGPLPSGCIGLLKQFWQRLETVEEKAVSV